MADATPLWEHDISFKKALAIAAVQQRKFKTKLEGLRSRCTELEREVATLKEQLARHTPTASTLVDLLTPNQDNDRSPASDAAADGPEEGALQYHLACLAAWINAENVLQTPAKTVLAQVQVYNMRKQLASSVANRRLLGPSATSLLGAPVPALVSALEDLTAQCASLSNRRQEFNQALQAVDRILACLATLCLQPSHGQQPVDFLCLQRFVSRLLPTYGIESSSDDHKSAEMSDNVDDRMLDATTNASASCRTTTIVTHSIDQLRKNGAGTGLILLGCAAHALHAAVEALVDDLVRLSPEKEGNATSAACPIEGEHAMDHACPKACIRLADVVQACLRDLPAWTVVLPPSDDYLRAVAEDVWNAGERCKLAIQMHPELREVQRCGAILMDALQQVVGPNLQQSE
jgi:hypothetical protein